MNLALANVLFLDRADLEDLPLLFDGWLIGTQKLKKSAALALLSERTSSSCTETTNLLLLEPLDATELSDNSLLECDCFEVAVCTGVDIVERRALRSNEPQDRDTIQLVRKITVWSIQELIGCVRKMRYIWTPVYIGLAWSGLFIKLNVLTTRFAMLPFS